jgi:predicted transcriptional regulator
MPEANPLDFEARRRLYDFIQANPGLHAREIQRLLTIPMTTLTYHLRALEKRGLVVAKEEKYYRRFYPAQGISPEDKLLVSALRHRRMRDIILYALMNGGATYRELLETLRLPTSTLYLYLKELTERGVLERRPEVRGGLYLVHNEGGVVRLLQTYHRSFLDRAVDAVLEVWLEQNYGSRPPRGKGSQRALPRDAERPGRT